MFIGAKKFLITTKARIQINGKFIEIPFQIAFMKFTPNCVKWHDLDGAKACGCRPVWNGHVRQASLYAEDDRR